MAVVRRAAVEGQDAAKLRALGFAPLRVHHNQSEGRRPQSPKAKSTGSRFLKSHLRIWWYHAVRISRVRDRMVPRLPNGVRTLAALLIPAALSFPALADEARDARGEAVYRTHCAECHSGSVMRAPSFATLRQLSAAAIKAALTSGTMSTQGHALSPAEIDAVSRFLGSNLVATANAVTECAETRPVPADAFADPYWNGWGGDATQHRFQPAAMAATRRGGCAKC